MQWQPMETAPKDGTPILIFHDLYWDEWSEDMIKAFKRLKHGDSDHGGRQSRFTVAAWESWAPQDCGWQVCGFEVADIPGNPICWMPLPETPEGHDDR